MAETGTNIEVVGCSNYVHKDEKGYFIYIAAKARPTTQTGIKCYVEEFFKPHMKNMHKKEEET